MDNDGDHLSRIARFLFAMAEPKHTITATVSACAHDEKMMRYWWNEARFCADFIREKAPHLLARPYNQGWLWTAIEELVNGPPQDNELIAIAQHAANIGNRPIITKRILLQCAFDPLVRGVWLDAIAEANGTRPKAVSLAWRPWAAKVRYSAAPSASSYEAVVLLPREYGEAEARAHAVLVWGEDRIIEIKPAN